MNLVLQAIKSLFDGVKQTATALGKRIDKAQSTADTAKTSASKANAAAQTAQDTADTKMSAANPVGSGTFSMNECVSSGDGSVALGAGTVAIYPQEFATGRYNVAGPKWEIVRKKVPSPMPYMFNASKFYASEAYVIDEEKGRFTLIDPVEVTTISQAKALASGIYVVPAEANPYQIYEFFTYTMDSTGTVLKGFTYFYSLKAQKMDKYAHIVGNGTADDARSNAHTLDWDGNAWYAGAVEGTAMIVASSTEGSTKRFKITVDDSGTLTATEVT